MQHPFVSLWEKPSRLVVGLMSGTSADGVDPDPHYRLRPG